MRLFFALWPSPPIARQLAEIAEVSAGRFGGRATRKETIHLTLAFLGEVPEARLPLAIQAAQNIKETPFALSVDYLGYWKRNHLLWAGNSSPNEDLNKLAGALRQALAEAGFAIDREKPVFAPHISLVRKLPEASAPTGLPAIETITWPCSRFVLVRSRLSAAGPDYETVAEFPLA